MVSESYTQFDEKMLEKLKQLGFKEEKPGKFETLRLKGKCVVILYKSGKLLLQGNEEQLKSLKKILKPRNTGQLELVDETLVGTDEALKGDTFGGVVVAGVRANKRTRKKLLHLGVKDSKALNKAKIELMARKIMEGFPYRYIELNPAEYNRKVKAMGLTRLLNKLHKECYKKLKTKKSKHIVDKYPGCNIADVALEKGESKCVEIAAASIIARFIALRQINELSKAAGFRIPLGSTHVAAAIRKLKQKNLPLEMFLKLHFANVQKDL